MEIFVVAVLEKIGEALLDAFVGNVTDDIWTKLKGDPTKKAFQYAVAAATQRYAVLPLRLDLARPLLEKDSFLTLPAVAQEVIQVVRFEREPNAALIGQQWKTALDSPPSWCDFTYETRRLLEYLQIELRNTEVFRPVFDAKRLDAIATNTTTSNELLARMEAQLADLARLMDTRLSELIHNFSLAPAGIQEQIRDYTRFIGDKTHDFVGRKFIFEAVTRFIETQPRGYFFIRGDPGIGKSALAAQMVRVHGYVHHFNNRSEGINKTESFLRNICAQLIVAYQLDYAFLPPDATQDAGFLMRLLGEISDKLKANERAVIVVDALDEVDMMGLSSDANTLYLPVILPHNGYVVVTTRKIPLSLRIDCEQGALDIEHDSAGNIADVHEYVVRNVTLPGIQAYITKQEIDNDLFIDYLVQKSEGNFMYLHYVLPEIEHGAYTDLGLEALPAGLLNYYDDHWRRMRGENEEAWFRYKLPVIMALTGVKEPVSIDLIADFSGVQERARIREVLHDWGQFLHEEQILYKDGLQKRYYVYHASFHDFIAKKEEVDDERVSRKAAQEKFADLYWSELFDDKQ